MKLSSNQAHQLFVILQDSIKMDLRGFFTFRISQRVDLFNQIGSQQSDELKELDDDE